MRHARSDSRDSNHSVQSTSSRTSSEISESIPTTVEAELMHLQELKIREEHRINSFKHVVRGRRRAKSFLVHFDTLNHFDAAACRENPFIYLKHKLANVIGALFIGLQSVASKIAARNRSTLADDMVDWVETFTDLFPAVLKTLSEVILKLISHAVENQEYSKIKQRTQSFGGLQHMSKTIEYLAEFLADYHTSRPGNYTEGDIQQIIENDIALLSSYLLMGQEEILPGRTFGIHLGAAIVTQLKNTPHRQAIDPDTLSSLIPRSAAEGNTDSNASNNVKTTRCC